MMAALLVTRPSVWLGSGERFSVALMKTALSPLKSGAGCVSDVVMDATVALRRVRAQGIGADVSGRSRVRLVNRCR